MSGRELQSIDIWSLFIAAIKEGCHRWRQRGSLLQILVIPSEVYVNMVMKPRMECINTLRIWILSSKKPRTASAVEVSSDQKKQLPHNMNSIQHTLQIPTKRFNYLAVGRLALIMASRSIRAASFGSFLTVGSFKLGKITSQTVWASKFRNNHITSRETCSLVKVILLKTSKPTNKDKGNTFESPNNSTNRTREPTQTKQENPVSQKRNHTKTRTANA